VNNREELRRRGEDPCRLPRYSDWRRSRQEEIVFGSRRWVVSLAGLILFAGCIPPDDRRPGLWLSGSEVNGPVADWSFSEAYPEIFVETRTWYLLRHSITTVCAASGDRLYVPSLYLEGGSFPEARRWNRNVVRDPRVRLQIGDRLYPRKAVLVTDEAERAQALAAFAAKYPFWREIASKPPEQRPAMAFVRMDPPDATPSAAELQLEGRVRDAAGRLLAGAMVSAHDEERALRVTVFSDAEGRYRFPALAARPYRVQEQRIGFAPAQRDFVPGRAASEQDPALDFSLDPVADVADQLPPSFFYALLDWPTREVEGNFARACANCHPIGDHRWRRPRGRSEWEAVFARMDNRGPSLSHQARELLIPTLVRTFGTDAPRHRFEAPPPPRGDAVRAVVWEYEVDPQRRPSCHDLEIGPDGTVYTEDGYTLQPKTMQRGRHVFPPGAHSIEQDAQGNMWVTVTGSDQLAKLDVRTGRITLYDHPQIGEDKGIYPHTLQFDGQGRIWYTLSGSTHVARFDPATAEFRYFRLPPRPVDAWELSPVPGAYGCDVAPDQSVWWSELMGPRIGEVDPESGEVSSWVTPLHGPRRLGAGPDNRIWVPFFGDSQLGRFDPQTESWKLYPLPTLPAGAELPYALTVHRGTGHVWITGSNSDTLIRFEPETERFTVYPLPTPVNWTREIEFDAEGNVWTCTSDAPSAPDRPGSGRFIKLQLLEREGACGDARLQLGEDCDDGNSATGDGCSERCLREG
jgi:cysteine-rich repeat protein